jgi:hypothetical protein
VLSNFDTGGLLAADATWQQVRGLRFALSAAVHPAANSTDVLYGESVYCCQPLPVAGGGSSVALGGMTSVDCFVLFVRTYTWQPLKRPVKRGASVI